MSVGKIQALFLFRTLFDIKKKCAKCALLLYIKAQKPIISVIYDVEESMSSITKFIEGKKSSFLNF